MKNEDRYEEVLSDIIKLRSESKLNRDKEDEIIDMLFEISRGYKRVNGDLTDISDDELDKQIMHNMTNRILKEENEEEQ